MKAAVLAVGLVGAEGMRPWMNPSDTPESRAQKLVAQMTLEEKVSLLHGTKGSYVGQTEPISRLGVPGITMNDGPQGFRDNAHPGSTTSWPAALTVSATWDAGLLRSWGEAMGEEFAGKGSMVQLGPGVCLARVPRNGRNFEYLSGEDPFLGYTNVQPVVAGIQSKGVVANVKHWVDNNQETDRTTVSEAIDERTEFEMYYPPFEGAFKAGVGSLMCSYNKICYDCQPEQMGNWSCENWQTLKVDLKQRLGFKGWVMSDWGATHSTSIERGLDQEMPGGTYMGSPLTDMVKAGKISEDAVTESAERVLTPLFAVGQFDNPLNGSLDNNVTSSAHNQLARDISAAGTILLKNDGVLPIPASAKTIAIIGTQAQAPIVHGGGSGQVVPYYSVSPLEGIRSRFGIPSIPANNCSQGSFLSDTDFYNTDKQTSAPAGSAEDCCNLCAGNPDCNAFTLFSGTCWMKGDNKNTQQHKGATSGTVTKQSGSFCNKDGVCVKYATGSDTAAAASLAASSDVAIVFVGTTSSEGGDRKDLSFGDQDDLVRAVAAQAGKKTVVVAVTPAAALTPWRDQVAAVVTPLMPGQEYGNAIADVLFGDVNPSAKLPITFPSAENETQFSQTQWPGVDKHVAYSERLEVGYRYYSAHNITPAYAFGHGLSYTTFGYSDLQVSGRTVSFSVKNTGSVAGSEVAQLYLDFPQSAGEPPKQLKGFQKLTLKAGETTRASIQLDDRSFSVWSVASHSWEIPSGSFGVMVGSSSADVRLTGTVSP
eukprot:Hpha_TRINITY_DN12167_c0_g2::TRINITY_DN12167_c0_g2_i1::g.82093::m.82093/K05349/bglX; beta-glucosidase